MTQAQGNPADTDASAVADLRDYLDAAFGDTEGYAHVAAGASGYFDDAGKYSFKRTDNHRYAKWRPLHHVWPADADRLADDLHRMRDTCDAYVCPYLMSGTTRTPDDAVELTKIHADIDGDCPLDKVADLGGWAVSTGSPGHAHVYVDLAEPVPAHWHTALCRGLGAHLGDADAKIRANDVLRPPGTLNHKSRARGGESTAVEWLIRPSGVRWDAAALAAKLGITLPDTPGTTGTKAKRKTKATGRDCGAAPADNSTPFDLDAHPEVSRALVDVTDPPDRSVDTMRVVAAVYDAELTLEHARWAVAQRADLCERLDGRRDDDVLTCWEKIAADREQVTLRGLDDEGTEET